MMILLFSFLCISLSDFPVFVFLLFTCLTLGLTVWRSFPCLSCGLFLSFSCSFSFYPFIPPSPSNHSRWLFLLVFEGKEEEPEKPRKRERLEGDGGRIIKTKDKQKDIGPGGSSCKLLVILWAYYSHCLFFVITKGIICL